MSNYLTKNIVLVLNIDKLKNKNCYQFRSMGKYGYQYHVFSYTNDGSSMGCGCNYVTDYPKSVFYRAIKIVKFLSKHGRSVHHIELYTGCSNFIILEYWLAKLFGIPVCIVERGALKDLNKRGFVGRVIRRYLFRYAAYVWIRELWMQRALQGIRSKDCFFLSNTIDVPNKHNNRPEKNIEFLWCNSLKSWRNPMWFIDALKQPVLLEKKAVLVGFLKNNASLQDQQQIIRASAPSNVELVDFTQPEPYYLNSKFFVLPADIVFLNYSLLEAMAYGVVPIVSDVDGARQIVDDGENGFVVPHNKNAFCDALLHAASITDERYMIMSKNARAKVIAQFSLSNWSVHLANYYSQMHS